jgi:endonuclease/exonuclease/phosphatase (EEP) superfamily protein YafD
LVFPSGIWPFELLEAFAMYALACCMVIVILGLVMRSAQMTVGAVLASALLAWHVWPYIPIPSVHPHEKDARSEVRVGVFNVLHDNDRHGAVADAILSSDCDVLCVLEVSSRWEAELEARFSATHPHRVSEPQEVCCWGMALYSRFPIKDHHIYYLTRDPVIRASVQAPQGEVDVWAVHTRPPIFPNDTEERNALMMMVAQEIAQRGRPAILAGDLNIVPWAADLRKMADVGGLMDTRRGYLPTFPADIGIPLIPIDHVLYSRHFRSAAARTVMLPGSDHRGLVASMAWQDGQR